MGLVWGCFCGLFGVVGLCWVYLACDQPLGFPCLSMYVQWGASGSQLHPVMCCGLWVIVVLQLWQVIVVIGVCVSFCVLLFLPLGGCCGGVGVLVPPPQVG